MFNIIFNPLKEIEADKKRKNSKKTWMKIIIGSLIVGVFALIIGIRLGFGWTLAIGFFAQLFILSFLGTLFNAWLYKLAIHIISSKGKFKDTLTALSNGLIVTAIGLLIGSLILLIPLAPITNIIGLLFVALMISIGYAVTIKTLTALTNADLLSVVVATVIVTLAGIIAYILIMSITLALNPQLAGSLPTGI